MLDQTKIWWTFEPQIKTLIFRKVSIKYVLNVNDALGDEKQLDDNNIKKNVFLKKIKVIFFKGKWWECRESKKTCLGFQKNL